jgi:Protein of unknown function (DUF3298)/Deacetylase PdaC
MTLKKITCLLVLALLVFSLQACRNETAKSDLTAQPAAQSQTSPQPNSPQPGETVVPAPSKFDEVFAGAIDDRHAIRMELERKDADLSGSYYYERAGAFNAAMRTLELKGRIDGDGNVTLTEMTQNYKTGKPQKTGEFKGKLDGLSANGDIKLRFSGVWTGGRGGKQAPFGLQQLRYGLGALKLGKKDQKSADKKLRYQIEATLPEISGADSARVEKFNQAVANLVAAHTREFKKAVAEMAREDASAANPGVKQNSKTPPNSLNLSYEVTAANKDYISILFSFFEYTGGAHPNTTTESFNYDLNRNTPVKLADLFTPNSNYLNVISDYAVKELKKLETVDNPEEGAGPKLDNFHSWNITFAGLKITFDRYQVGAYAAGEHEVVVPYSVLKPIINPDGMLAQFAK